MQILFYVFTALTALVNLISFYIAVTALWTFKKHVPHPKAAPKLRFAVIIPARNEEGVLGNLIRALRDQTYPAGMVDIFVAANHCTDRTGEVAVSCGAQVLHCPDSVRCKGDVLHFAVEQLLPGPWDAFCIFDADNLPEKDFLQRINDAMAAGERVCRSRLKAGNALQSWVSGGYALYHAMMEWTYSRPHTAMGFSSNLVGTAFAVHREVFEAMGGWNTMSICEDSEFAAQCSRLGYRVAFVQEALSYDEQVASFRVSLHQRRRWCYGMIQAARHMIPSMFSAAVPRKGMSRDFGILMVLSHTVPVGALLMLLSLPLQPPLAIWLGLGSMLLSGVGLILLAVLFSRLGGYPTRRMWRAILMYPIFTVSWIPLQIAGLFFPVREWTAIRHHGQDPGSLDA